MPLFQHTQYGYKSDSEVEWGAERGPSRSDSRRAVLGTSSQASRLLPHSKNEICKNLCSSWECRNPRDHLEFNQWPNPPIFSIITSSPWQGLQTMISASDLKTFSFQDNDRSYEGKNIASLANWQKVIKAFLTLICVYYFSKTCYGDNQSACIG